MGPVHATTDSEFEAAITSAQLFRQLLESARVPVVVLTASRSQDEIDRCYELGDAAVLNKPLRLHEYREMLAAFERFWLGHVRFAQNV